MIVLDASVLIAHVEPNDGFHPRAVELLSAQGGEPLAASPITLAEFFVAPARAGRLDVAARVVDELGVVEIQLPDDAARRLAVLRRDTRLTMPDCCVLLAAQQRAAAVASFDTRVLDRATDLGLRTVR